MRSPEQPEEVGTVYPVQRCDLHAFSNATCGGVWDQGMEGMGGWVGKGGRS